jgi:Peptidase family M23
LLSLLDYSDVCGKYKVLFHTLMNYKSLVLLVTLIWTPLLSLLPQKPAFAACEASVSVGSKNSDYSRGASWSTCNGYKFIFQPDGNVVLYNSANVALWATGTEGSRVDRFSIQADGNVVLYEGSRAVWASNTSGSPGSRFIVQADGNVVIYNASGQAIFSTGTVGGKRATTSASQTWCEASVSVGSKNLDYSRGASWSTCNGNKLTFQPDGNVVLYSSSNIPLWATGTEGSRVDKLSIQADGNVVLYEGSRPVWASNTAGAIGSRFVVQTDGNVVIYNSSSQAIFSTATAGGKRATTAASQIWLNQNKPPSPVNPLLSGDIDLPFSLGETWYVCQGYGGPISHQGFPALDLSIGQDFGANNSCWATDGNVNRSAGKTVTSPADGKIAWVESDVVCVSIDDRRSVMIGHMSMSVSPGQQVSKGTVLGTVNNAGVARNGGFAHIHVEARKSSNCKFGTSTPFSSTEGLKFRGVGDLPLGQTHWKLPLTRP